MKPSTSLLSRTPALGKDAVRPCKCPLPFPSNSSHVLHHVRLSYTDPTSFASLSSILIYPERGSGRRVSSEYTVGGFYVVNIYIHWILKVSHPVPLSKVPAQLEPLGLRGKPECCNFFFFSSLNSCKIRWSFNVYSRYCYLLIDTVWRG